MFERFAEGILLKAKPFDYPCVEPPFRFKPLREMTEVEAREYFTWFTGQSESRRTLLLDMAPAIGGPKSTCDYTFESLVPPWRTLSPLFAKREMTTEEGEALFQRAPAAAKKLPLDLAELTTATGCLATDIGFYVAEIFVRKHPKMQWTTFKEEEGPLNEPMIAGFKLQFIPYHLVVACIWKQLKRPKDEWLFDAVQHWETENVLPEFE